jgi:hypothetical protein
MKAVRVKFENEAYNYITSVNPKATKKDLEDYFIGKQFNMGVFPAEDFQKCIDIDFKTKQL